MTQFVRSPWLLCSLLHCNYNFVRHCIPTYPVKHCNSAVWIPVGYRPVIFRHFQSACRDNTGIIHCTFSVSQYFASFEQKSFVLERLASTLAKARLKEMGKPKEDTRRQNGQTHVDKDIVRANGHAADNRPFSISCEWDIKQTQQFSDDGTNTYFW